ncbi:hypothetical protein Poly51_10830 [Rubripirellula tenax]|uniref:HEAT repeat protein n=1 Tax=Rubripirellula tenax TaxID=2528015 RepID=A0A5C6FMR5_9BACT|nr:hypothetical protein [Rubripirellula tenax]TWU60802.1 hypothetical protein Poly51_10830 [Rubripirellula tenax]
MQSGDLTDYPNPFAMAAAGKSKPRHSAVRSALKFLILVAICFAIVLGISVGSKRYLMHRLTADFDSLSAADKQNRLVQMAEMGSPAIEPLAAAMAHSDIDVARTAYDLLRNLQNKWTVLTPSQQQTRHRELVTAISSVSAALPDDRTGWAVTLIQQTITEVVARTDASSRDLYRRAGETLDLLTLSNRSGPSIIDDDAFDPSSPQRLQVRGRPYPVSIENEPPVVNANDPPPPSIYKSAAMRLQPVNPDQTIVLRDVQAAKPAVVEKPPIRKETEYFVEQVQATNPGMQPTLVDSPMETYDDASVIHWLASEHGELRDKAKLELMSRGFSRDDLRLAARIATADVPTRMELVDRIAREPSIDPRPWLWMMSRDESREVRLRVISVIATMNDRDARNHLQKLMIDESDPIVAARLRKVLQLR